MLRKTLFDKAIQHQEGVLDASERMLCVQSGKHTSRYAKGKYIVCGDYDIEFNQYHKPISRLLFCEYWKKAQSHLGEDPILGHYQVGNHPTYNVHVKVETKTHWHQILSSFLFISRRDNPLEKWHLRHCPDLSLSAAHPTLIAISIPDKQILITGTGYGGEIKKSMFTVMNLILPDHDILPLHCSAVLSSSQETSLLLGLSGTGKTTLSSFEDLTIVGDDEHAWSPEGVFNLEGGSYAKTLNLSEKNEPSIYRAIHKMSILENVHLENGKPDFKNSDITENTRAAYPLQNLPKCHNMIAPQPKNIIFLCCDLFGVIPALSLLTPKQALEHFLMGYTAKVGSTEGNGSDITPIFSPCFGHPFFPRPLQDYAHLFEQKITRYTPKIWLINTGWCNGDYQTGSRYPIPITRKILTSIMNHDPASFLPHPYLDLNYATAINGLSLDFSQDWKKSELFKKHSLYLKSLFKSRQLQD